MGGLAAIALVLAWLVSVTPKVHADTTGSSDPQDPSATLITSTVAPPTEAQCHARGQRCFAPAAVAGAYDYKSLHDSGIDGRGYTIALVDSFGSQTVASDLNNFDTAFGLQHLCGETGYTCQPGDPTFKILTVQGTPPTTPPPPNNGTGQEAHDLWAVEVSLDVEWAHATAPGANILLVTSPTAETLGVQGLPAFMNAEQYLVDNHLADVISQSFGTGEGAFHNGLAALQNLRHAFISAQANHVTVLASTGDNGTANVMKEPVKNPAVIPYPSVGWPASDPLVTAVGGTYLCMDSTTGTTIDSSPPSGSCPAFSGQREVGWIAGGGGYSILFPRPAYQNTLPAGSTFVGSSAGAPGPNSNMRGIPDISYQASARTGLLVYDEGEGGWFVVGGTSCSSPQWAGLVAMADQIKGSDIGFMNPALYSIASNPAKYAADFHDITTGNNQLDSSIPGYSASTGWDAVTGLGTPDAAKLLPDLAAAS
jgi:subtilase family serine protease